MDCHGFVPTRSSAAFVFSAHYTYTVIKAIVHMALEMQVFIRT